MGLGTECKEETPRMENISIESFGRKKLCYLVEENCVFIYIYLWDLAITEL
jgi:hypothetical protein